MFEMKRTVFAVVAVGAAALALGAGLQAITLKRTPKVGEKVKYTFSGTMSVGGTEIKLSANGMDRITAVEADGSYTTETTQTDTKVNDQAMPEEAPVSIVQKPSGEILKLTGGSGDPTTLRLQNLVNFYFPSSPVNVGDTWSLDLKPAVEGGVPVHVDMKLVGREKVGDFDTAKIDGTAKETQGDKPATIHNVFWVNVSDGTPVKQTSELANVALGPQTVEKGHIEMSRTGS